MPDRQQEIAASLRERIISGLHLGSLQPGRRLPSTREVATEFEVAPRTAMAAYRLLQGEGLVELRPRSGIYVAPGTMDGVRPMVAHLSGWIVDVLLEARAREIPPVDFPERVRRCLTTLRVRGVCLATNDDQLDQVCRELDEDYGIESTGLTLDDMQEPSPDTRNALLQADLIVSTSLTGAVAQDAARRLHKPTMIVRLRKELMADITRQMAKEPVYIIGSDPRFRDAMHAAFDPLGHAANARAMILGEDNLESIPGHSPTFIMRRAHDMLGDTPLARRVVPIRRVFAAEMARELLGFVVRANMAALAARG